jgi:hypothetical protein
MNRTFSLVFSLLPLAAVASAMLLVPTGCSAIGCFPASEAGGNCPAQEATLPYFGDPACGGTVESVDSDATVKNGNPGEGTLCCYAISNKESEYTSCPDL